MTNDLKNAIRVLLDLKSIKEAIERGEGTPFQRDYYEKNKESAWVALRAADKKAFPNWRLPSALVAQEGGQHYKGLTIQPVQYMHANQLDYNRAAVVKYVTRDKTKGGAEDIKKAIHFARFILEQDYGIRSSNVEYEGPL